jgi:hypothetical protein
MKTNLVQKVLGTALIAAFSFGIAGSVLTRGAPSEKEAGTKKPQAGRGATNQVLVLDGENGYMQVPDSPSLHTISNAITLEALCLAHFFYPDPGSVNSILRKNIGEGAENFFLRIRNTDGPPLIEMGLGNELGIVRAPAELKTNQWYHLAGAYDGSA